MVIMCFSIFTVLISQTLHVWSSLLQVPLGLIKDVTLDEMRGHVARLVDGRADYPSRQK